MCFGALKAWEECELDAKRAIELDDKYAKAYFWLTKAAVSVFMYLSLEICYNIIDKTIVGNETIQKCKNLFISCI